MAIIAIMSGIVLVAAWNSRKAALQAVCLNNIRQLGMSRVGGGLQGGPVAPSGDLECPMGATYALNALATDISQATHAPANTVMLFEAKDVTIGTESDVWPLHHGGCNYVYWDGHAKWSKQIPPFKPL